jgi:hypothetical protein
MCVPVPGLFAEEGPRACPGRAKVSVDIVYGMCVCIGDRECD